VLGPYYPASGLFRVTRDGDGLQVDFMTRIHGVKSFEGVRDRATPIDVDGTTLLVASLDDVIRSKKAARRPRDLAVIEVLEKARDAKAREVGAKAAPRRARPRK
jgi:predicted nucleotidyltransferase